jgi:ssDNA-binding Zn-finger/Zn-ribbon topoisomerase 1
MNLEAPKCPNCGQTMVLRTKGADKFFGCPNYRNCGAKTIAFQGQKTYPKPTYTPQQTSPSGGNSDVLLALREVYKEVASLRKEFSEFAIVFGNKQVEEREPIINQELL